MSLPSHRLDSHQVCIVQPVSASDVVWDMLNWLIFVYCDDILICFKSHEQYIVHISTSQSYIIFSKLVMSKWKFHACSLSLLGYFISCESIQMDLVKASAVTSWPVPDFCKQLQSVLGFNFIASSSGVTILWLLLSLSSFQVLSGCLLQKRPSRPSIPCAPLLPSSWTLTQSVNWL